MNIASQYGLEEEFDLPDIVPATQTVEQEYTAYVTGMLSVKGTNILAFWQVCLFLYYAGIN
jgi:hypothetical protein